MHTSLSFCKGSDYMMKHHNYLKIQQASGLSSFHLYFLRKESEIIYCLV